MSYDVWLEAERGGFKPVSVGGLSANMTYNVGGMFSAVIGHSITQWDGRPAAEVANACATILDAFNRNPAKFKAMEPTNGWGDFDGARAFIQMINDACVAAPKAVVRVC